MADPTNSNANFKGMTQRAAQRIAETVRAVRQMPRDATGTPNPWNSVGVVAGSRLVKLANPTGSAGSNTTPSAPTYVYDISDPSTGTTIATAVPVLFARQLGHVTAGTWGLAQKVVTTVGGTAAWQLFVVDEVYDAVEACT